MITSLKNTKKIFDFIKTTWYLFNKITQFITILCQKLLETQKTVKPLAPEIMNQPHFKIVMKQLSWLKLLAVKPEVLGSNLSEFSQHT